MTKIINLPFQGFYHSCLEAIIDDFLEAEAYNCEESNPTLDVDTYTDLLAGASDFEGMRKALALAYIDELNEVIQEEVDFQPCFTFESLVSPREYNFETDKLFAHVSPEVIQAMYDLTSPMTLADVIRERHSSRPGFISFYSNDLQDWLNKPLHEWDANELCTLLLAFLEDNVEADWEQTIIENLHEKQYELLANHVDWPKFDDSVRNALRNTL